MKAGKTIKRLRVVLYQSGRNPTPGRAYMSRVGLPSQYYGQRTGVFGDFEYLQAVLESKYISVSTDPA